MLPPAQGRLVPGDANAFPRWSLAGASLLDPSPDCGPGRLPAAAKNGSIRPIGTAGCYHELVGGGLEQDHRKRNTYPTSSLCHRAILIK
jgi:hypothetical protein